MPTIDHQGTAIRIAGFALGPFETNCYVVNSTSDECWIVDAGYDPTDLIDWVRTNQLRPSKLLLTHAHMDHIAGIQETLAAFPGIPILLHEAEHAWLNDPELNLSVQSGIPLTTPGPDGTLSDHDHLTLDELTFKIDHTPGHSPGSVTLSCETERLALVGDTLFAGSIGRFDFPTSNEHDLFRSIRERLYPMHDETRVFPGHGPATTIGREKHTNPFVRAE